LVLPTHLQTPRGSNSELPGKTSRLAGYDVFAWFLIGLLMTMTVIYQNAVMADTQVIKTQLPILPVRPLYPPQYQSTRGQQND
jgi:hypothetical protein